MDPAAFDPDNFLPRPRRHTDQPRPFKPTPLPVLTPLPATRPRTRSFNHVSASLETSELSLVGNGHNRVQIKADRSMEVGEVGRPRRNSGGEVTKRILALALPQKRGVYTKDLDLVDTKVKLAHLHVQWPVSVPGQRKSKSASRNRLGSPEDHVLPRGGVKSRKSERPGKAQKVSTVPSQRCASEEKRRMEESDMRKASAFKGPSACNLHTVDLLLVRQYNEDQQHLLATIRDLTSGKLEPHSILRCRMQEYAPWTACALTPDERVDKAVRFV